MCKRISLSLFWICQQMFCSPRSIQVILNYINKMDHITFESIVFSLLLIQKIGKFQTLDSRFCEKWHVTLLWSNLKNVRLIMGSLSGFWSRLNQWKNFPTATVELRMEMIFTEIVITCGCQQICWHREERFRGFNY